MNEKDNTVNKDEITKALKILHEDQSKRIQACLEEIEKVLDKYDLDMTISTPNIALLPRK